MIIGLTTLSNLIITYQIAPDGFMLHCFMLLPCPHELFVEREFDLRVGQPRINNSFTKPSISKEPYSKWVLLKMLELALKTQFTLAKHLKISVN
jgi:hypothetical protein